MSFWKYKRTWYRAEKVKKATLKKKKIDIILISLFFHVFSLTRCWKACLSNWLIDCRLFLLRISNFFWHTLFSVISLSCFNILWHTLLFLKIIYSDSTWVSNAFLYVFVSFNVISLISASTAKNCKNHLSIFLYLPLGIFFDV